MRGLIFPGAGAFGSITTFLFFTAALIPLLWKSSAHPDTRRKRRGRD